MRISILYSIICVGFIFCESLSYLSAQNTNDIKVYFFKTESSTNGDAKDSTVVYADQHSSNQQNNNQKSNNALLGIHGDVTMNGTLNFVGLPANSTINKQSYRCVTAINDGKYWGNLFFYGQKWENAELGDMSGDGMVSFNGKAAQSIENSKNNKKRAKFPGIQINNQNHVSLQGEKAIRIDKYAVFYAGKLKHSRDTIFFSKTIDSAFCDDKDSYIELSDFTSGQALVAKDTVHHKNQSNKNFNFRFPFGSSEAYAPLTVVFKEDAQNSSTNNADNKVFSVFARFDKDMPGEDIPPFPARKRYDKGARSFWSVKSNIPLTNQQNSSNNKYLIPDSIYAGLEKSYSKKLSINFRPDRAFITQYVDPNTHNDDPKPTMGEKSNWDLPKLNEEQLRPALLKLSKAGKQTVLLQYKRDGKGTNLRLLNDADAQNPHKEQYSYYTIANYDKHPLTSLFENTKINYNQDLCAIEAEWTFSDQFSGQRYFIEITSDTTLVNDNTKEGVVSYRALVNDNLASISNNGNTYRYNLYNSQLPPDLFTPDMKLYARILEEDLGGMTVSSSSKAFNITCKPHESDEEVPLVSAFGTSGGGAQMVVQYKAKYPEELNFSIWNILGQKEVELGSSAVNPGLNNITFNLPVNITRGHRYLLLITGGGFNEKVKTYSLTFSIK